MSAVHVPEVDRRRQRDAADPGRSVWVSANAGAGKTKVLTDRVVRLLLAGAPPSRILCLTFTKAAAAEMTGRVLRTLGSWASLDEPALAEALRDLTGDAPDAETRARARRLFARAVETPGGLKIETIHAFCERLLHLVPFEANVPPRFATLDESQADELRARARGLVLADAASREPAHARLTDALEVVGADAVGDNLLRLLDDAARSDLLPAEDETDAAAERLRAGLGLSPDETPDALRRLMLEGGLDAGERRDAAAALRRTGAKTDADAAAWLDSAGEGEGATRLAAYLKVFLTDAGAPRKQVGTKAVAEPVKLRLAAERERLVALSTRLLSAQAVERSRAAWVLAAAIRGRYEALKQGLGALDFGDLIGRTLRLLDGPAGAWALYRLDRGVDHVLVDEAQDTNPDQWRILQRITEEFTAGAGRPASTVRTVFAVGDPKQSIFSFQGADPRSFEASRLHWERRTAAAALRFDHVRLSLSFRSTALVLRSVDDVFGLRENHRGLAIEDGAVGTVHAAARVGAPGHLEIWPTEPRAEGGRDPDAWATPVDLPDELSPAVRAADRIARAVAEWTRGGAPGRPARWRPRDVLVLVRKRGPAFFQVIRALKAAGVPVAGADRFDVGEHIAVNDLVAAGSAALLPENDLALAAALKSPLVGLDDDDLVRLAADRGEDESLAAALDRLAPEDGAAARAAAALGAWRDLAREHGPFGFYAILLGPMGGRRAIVARLGGEAADAVDAFLCYAEAAEAGPEAPSLATFLARFENAAHTVKRDLDAAGDEVRVMTVHGAKGLEAPVVVMLDGCDVHGPEPRLIPFATDGGDLPVWSPRKEANCPAVAEARDKARDKALEEHNRLLYVAMTRARDWLVVAPFCGAAAAEPEEAWCSMIRRGLRARALLDVETPYGPAQVLRDEPVESAAGERDGAVPPLRVLPDWLSAPVAHEPERAALNPSEAGRADATGSRPPRAGRARAAARRRGGLLHGLVEKLADLPAPDRRAAASRWRDARAGLMGEAEAAALADAALAVIEHEALRPLFGPGSRSEAALAGRLLAPDGTSRPVFGQADRVAVGPDAVWVADFKTGEPQADPPPAYVAQLALYRALLAELHPGKPVRALLVWTEGPLVVEPAPDRLDAALAATLAGVP